MGLVPSRFVFWGFLRGNFDIPTVLFAMNLENCASSILVVAHNDEASN